jgi:hypothetical protein
MPREAAQGVREHVAGIACCFDDPWNVYCLGIKHGEIIESLNQTGIQ